MWYLVLITVVAAYFLGNINGAVCISTWLEHDDVRNHGSGNAGLTNFLRNYGGWSTLLVILIDMGKTAVACLLGGALLDNSGFGKEGMMLAAVASSLGHDFPALFGFKGGKGILSGFTAALIIDWRIGLIILAVFVICVVLSKYVSLASVMAAATFGICFVLFYPDKPWVAVGGVLMAVLAIFMHRANIARLCKGTENKFSIHKKEKH